MPEEAWRYGFELIRKKPKNAGPLFFAVTHASPIVASNGLSKSSITAGRNPCITETTVISPPFWGHMGARIREFAAPGASLVPSTRSQLQLRGQTLPTVETVSALTVHEGP